MSLLPSSRILRLNIFQLAAELSQHPFAQDEANELLRDTLRAQLRDWYAGEVVQPFASVHQHDVDEELYRKTRKIVRACRLRVGQSADEVQPHLL